MRASLLAVSVVLASLCASSVGSAAETATTGPSPGGLVVLDTTGSWRMHNTLKAPVIEEAGTLTPSVTVGASGVRGGAYWKQLLGQETAAPAAGWTKPQFDDGEWVRGTAGGFCRSPYLSRLCLRGRFTVTDAAQVKGLSLSVGYHGGAVVYLNGREVARKNVAAGAATAEPYPKDVFVDANGKLITLRGLAYLIDKERLTPDLARRIENRVRTLDVAIPAASLRQGVNVLAIEIIRSPYDKVLDEQKAVLNSHGTYDVNDLSWNTCELRYVQLRAASADGVVPNGTRPAGVQVWNSDPLAADFDVDFGAPAEELRPIRLVGARNGAYSGKVVVGSDKPIQGLVATVSDLGGKRGAIPAAQVQVRYALPWGFVPLSNPNNYEPTPYPAEATPMMALAEAPLEEFPVRKKETAPPETNPNDLWKVRKWGLGNIPLVTPNQPAPVFGAVVPVWVTVKVPPAAKPGEYAGRLTIQAGGRKVAEVPVQLKVVDWTVPDPQDHRTWVELIEAPDTTVVEYGIPMWSDKHWEMIARSLSFVGEMGKTVLYVPLIAETNAGNAESMVRWIKKGEDKYEFDFSIMDKYLDLAEKCAGKPRFVVFVAWDRNLLREGNARRKAEGYKLAKEGPLVTVVDAAGKTGNVMLSDYTEPDSAALWKPLFDELHRRMAKRGLEQAMLLGMSSDFWATKEQTAVLKEVSGNLPWINASHYFQTTFHGGLAGFGYQTTYFGARQGYGKSLHGWRSPDSHTAFERVALDTFPLARWRLLGEQCITGNVRGIGRLGADTWLAVKDKNGNRMGRVWQRWPSADWGYLNANSSALAAGPAGPVATSRFEALREGVQECEAIVLLEEALLDPARKAKLGEELARQCQETLNERNGVMWRSFISWQSGPNPRMDVTSWRENGSAAGNTFFLGSGWQERSEKLYTLAGLVQAKLAAPYAGS